MSFFPGTIKSLLLFFLLINSVGYAQTKAVIQNLYTTNFFYSSSIEGNSIHQADSIANTTGIARHFAGIYKLFMENISLQLKNADSTTQRFVTKFEKGFIDYFLKACIAYKNGNLPPESDWNCYFSHPDAQTWQTVLLGVNVHVNSDMWQALVANFNETEIRHYKNQFLGLQPSIVKGYSSFFGTVMTQNNYLKFINSFTIGFAKIIGERILYKWRRRSVHLAILYYHDPTKFEKKLVSVKRKKQKIDKIILRW